MQAGCVLKVTAGGGVRWPGLLPEPPAAGTDLTLVCLSVTLYTGRLHTRAVTRPLAPPRHLSSAENVRTVRLGAVLSSPHVAVGPSKIKRADATVLFAKLGGARAQYTSCTRDAAR